MGTPDPPDGPPSRAAGGDVTTPSGSSAPPVDNRHKPQRPTFGGIAAVVLGAFALLGNSNDAAGLWTAGLALSITLLIWRVAAHGRIRDVPLWVGLAFTARLGALRLSDGSSGGETVATSPSQSATGTRPSERIPLGPATSHPVGVGQIEAGDIMRSARWEGGSAM